MSLHNEACVCRVCSVCTRITLRIAIAPSGTAKSHLEFATQRPRVATQDKLHEKADAKVDKRADKNGEVLAEVTRVPPHRDTRPSVHNELPHEQHHQRRRTRYPQSQRRPLRYAAHAQRRAREPRTRRNCTQK